MADFIFNDRELVVISESQKRASESVDVVEGQVARVNWFLGAVVVVFFVGFLTMLVGIGGIIWAARQTYATSYNEYRITAQALEDRCQNKNEENINNKFQKIQDDLDSLWKSKYPIKR